ncbi:hypothetical protein GCM10010178_13370 [Lentzea flava]|uniref:DUF3558 domain-containing protein n=1 Tax=Lentzea flava TaxID=103732 RepID=A0ABQ2UCY7_9PSEU|nr:hypothetical protein GCM10010178_13370 [Lentzea flava]
MKSLRPCDLLTESEAFSFGLKLPGEASMIVGFNTCDWIIPGNGGLNAGINIDTGVKDLNINGDKESDVKVGKFTGVKVEGQDGSKDNCSILIAVSETSSVAVTANMRAGSGDRAGACERATKAADLIAQKLP